VWWGDIRGQSASAILELLVAGTPDPVRPAACATGKLKAKIPGLVDGFGPRRRFLTARHLAHLTHLDELDSLIVELDEEVDHRLAPFVEEVALLDTIPGAGLRTAEELVAEIGVGMTQFPDAAHLPSWAGMAPGNQLSAGKHKGGSTSEGGRSSTKCGRTVVACTTPTTPTAATGARIM
jgi:transposase